MRIPAWVLGLIASLLLLASGCSKKGADDAEVRASPESEGPLTIYTVNYPLTYFAEQMAPPGARIVFPTPRGVDPAFWKPPPDVVQEYQRADLILLNGAGYARWTQYTTLPTIRVVVTTRGCRDHFLRSEQSVRHRHGPEGEHAHTGMAFTTWLDLKLAACQARHVRDALVERAPNEKRTIAEGYVELERGLLGVDERLRRAGKAWGERPILASHPVYQYLADAYGLSIESLHLEPDRVLTEDDWMAVDTALRRQPVTMMLWEGPPLESTAKGLRGRGVEPVLFDPGGQKPADGDFLSLMRANADRFECATGVRECR